MKDPSDLCMTWPHIQEGYGHRINPVNQDEGSMAVLQCRVYSSVSDFKLLNYDCLLWAGCFSCTAYTAHSNNVQQYRDKE